MVTEITNPAHALVGLTLKDDFGDEWLVAEKIDKKPGQTGGHFSTSYTIKQIKSEKIAFLKAIDYSPFLSSPNTLSAMKQAIDAYDFERKVLEKCKNKKLSRVVTPLFFGEVKVPKVIGSWDTVAYIVFDMADGNIRNIKSQMNEVDLAWALRTLHYSAVGLKQLHQNGIIHQDLKPSNILSFSQDGARLSDLGRAKDKDITSPYDSLLCAGDRSYSAPEYLYDFRDIADEFFYKKRAELYQLGSLIFFFFTETSANGALMQALSLHEGKRNNLNFESELPILQKAFIDSLTFLKKDIEKISTKYADEITTLASELCDPDPRTRGIKSFNNLDERRYDLERYISKINVIAKKIEMGF